MELQPHHTETRRTCVSILDGLHESLVAEPFRRLALNAVILLLLSRDMQQPILLRLALVLACEGGAKRQQACEELSAVYIFEVDRDGTNSSKATQLSPASKAN